MTTKKKKPELKEVKSLTSEEMLKLEIANKNMRIVELEVIAINNKKKVMEMEFDKELESKRKQHSDLNEKRKSYIDSLCEKYELTNGLKGFDPLTGEIKDE